MGTGRSRTLLVAQSCLTFCNHMDCSPPGSSVHGILQIRIVEWVAIPFSRGSSQPRDGTRVSPCLLHWREGSLPLVPPGSMILPPEPPGKPPLLFLFTCLHPPMCGGWGGVGVESDSIRGSPEVCRNDKPDSYGKAVAHTNLMLIQTLILPK